MQFLTTGGEFLAAHEGFHLVGQDANLDLLSSILMRSKAASVLLVGPGGVGATALCMGLQELKGKEDAAFDIVSKRMFWLNTDELLSSGDSQKINSGWQKIIGILRRTPESILFIEDFRDFIEGSRNVGCSHFINSLASAVKQGDTQAVLECRDDDVAFVLKAHSDFKECFTMIELVEPTGESLDLIVHAASSALAKHHGIGISEEAIEASIALTTKYRTRDSSLSRAQPERSANLLDRALATLRLDAHRETNPDTVAKIRSVYKEVRDGEVQIVELEESLDAQLQKEKRPHNPADPAAQSVGSDEFADTMANAGFDSEPAREIRKKIKSYQQVVDDARGEFREMTSGLNFGLELTRDMVYSEFSRISGIPTSKLSQDELERLKSLGADLEKKVFGQHPVIEKLSNAIKVARIGGRHGNKPQAAFMFLGPSGVGKTELSKALSEILELDLLRLDMSEFMEKQSVAKLIGAPPGYEGFENGGILTNAMRKNGSRVVLFDEVEKADTSVFNILLQILSEGRLTDSAGLTVSFSDAIVILTSNIGQEYFLSDSIAKPDRLAMAIELLQRPTSEGGASLRPELLNRFSGRQNIVDFDRLDLNVIEMIVRREVSSIDSTYVEKGVHTVMPEASLKAFCKDHYDPVTGARGLPGYIEAMLEPIIVNTILDNPSFRGTVEVGYGSGKFTTALVEEKKAAAEPVA